MLRLTLDALAAIGHLAARGLPLVSVTVHLGPIHLGPVHHHIARAAPEPPVAVGNGDEDQPDDAPGRNGGVVDGADDDGPTAEHIDGEDCPCKPTTVPVERADGSIRFVYAHQIDPYADPANQADRAATIFEGMGVLRTDTDD